MSRILCIEDTLEGQLKLKWMQVEVYCDALCRGCPGRVAEAKAVKGGREQEVLELSTKRVLGPYS